VREYEKLVRLCAAMGIEHTRFLLRLAELKLIEKERWITEAKFPAVKSLDSFDFQVLPPLK
jgi:hypothetical protein